jgi:hypothetical protein
MSKISVSLNEYATGPSDGLGTVTLSFSAPPVGRIWQGTVTIPDASGTSSWVLSVGGQKFGNLAGPGPYGPLQAQSGQIIKLVGSGLSLSIPYTAVLSGINDPQESPSLYTGPSALPSPAAPGTVTVLGLPLFVAPSAPKSGAGNHPINEIKSFDNEPGAGSLLQLVAAPGAGLRFRVFSITIGLSNQSAAGDAAWIIFVTSAVFASHFARFDFGPSGLPLASNAAINLAYSGTLAYISTQITYTTESV